MEKIIYKDKEYNTSDYLDLMALSPEKLEGEAYFKDSGEIIQASDEIRVRAKHVENWADAKKTISILDPKTNKDKLIRRLVEKYKDKTINRWEFALLLKHTKDTRYDEATNLLYIDYNNYYTVNMDVPKPTDLSYQDYGRFMDMLNYCFNYNNELVYKNGKQIQKVNLKELLGFNSKRTFYLFLQNLKKFRMIGESIVGKKKFLVINPYYANRNVKITKETYLMFEEDLKKCFDDIEIEFILQEDIGFFDSNMVEVEV